MNSERKGPEPVSHTFLDSLSDAVILVEAPGLRVVEANRLAINLVGTSLEAMRSNGSVIDVISSSPIGPLEGLGDLLVKGEGSILKVGGTGTDPGIVKVEARSFLEHGSRLVLITLRKVESEEGTRLELERARMENRALMDTITDLVFSVDRSGKVVNVNQAVRSLGYREEEVIGRNIVSFTVPSYQQRTEALMESLFSGTAVNGPYSIEVLAKGGDAHLLKVRGRVVSEGGHPVLVQCVARDITPLVEADKALGESLWQYKSLFEHAHVAMWEVDAKDALAMAREMERGSGKSIQEMILNDPGIIMRFMGTLHFVDVNRECLDLFRANSKEDLFQNHGRIFPEAALPTLAGWVGSMLTGNSGNSWECDIKTLDGQDRSVVLRWGSLQSHRDSAHRILLSFIDTTDKMLAFKRLESEKRYADAIIDFAESLIIGVDMEGRITIFNRRAEQTTGIRREEVLGKSYFELFDTELDEESGRRWLRDLANGRGSVERIKALPGKGANPMIWWHNNVIESGGKLVMISLGVDITERVSLNQRLEDLNGSLLLLNRIMRHDIMNDLSIALGSLQLYEIKREGRYLDAATRALTKGVDLINDISDLERLRAPAELRAVKVRDVVDKVVANRAGQNVLIRVTGEATAMADETLSSVFDNLVGNAIMHGRTETVDIDISASDGECLVSVADRGRGIPDDIKARIFDEGFKFGDTGNTGFGLYIVRKTMEKFGGSVRVRDNHPQGTVFELRMPLPKPVTGSSVKQ
jgi:PAS domain S-box-containing protein